MILFIDASDYEQTKLVLVNRKIEVHSFRTHDLSENLLPEIIKFSKKYKVELKRLKKIAVVTGPGGFSRIRTAVAVSNALAFGLRIPVTGIKKHEVSEDLTKLGSMPAKKMTEPYYGKEPNITLSKNR